MLNIGKDYSGAGFEDRCREQVLCNLTWAKKLGMQIIPVG